ncbi:hypothetical protein EB796_009666 [Bugula neritina]|uniref:Uncharacterized protein n=1 Tax=Bugula neritina TaxID=10212 RepID=A0A7J7K1I8_BUGNE|nr:hypothetical protein EB796_009666 [Bugula neritina]
MHQDTLSRHRCISFRPHLVKAGGEGALQAFSDLVLESQCDVEVINKSSQSTYSVDLKIQGTSVAQKLVEEGVAVRQQRSPAPSTQHTPSPGSSKPASIYQDSFSSQLVDSQ